MQNALCASLIFLLFSCNSYEQKSTGTGKDSPGVKPTTQTSPAITSAEDFQTLVFTDLVYVPRDSAERMIENGRGDKCKKANGVTTYFTNADIQQLTNIPGVTSFRLDLACFGDVEGDKKNRPTILLVVEFSGSNQTTAPTPIYYSSRRICPPPDDCGRTATVR